ncbi:MAG: hypothetical protein ACRDY7_05875, partial [Acidimicrobiia bacterium]
MSLLPGLAGAGEDDFVVGSGRVRASLFEVVPRTGGLTIPYSFGKATASYQGSRAEATASVAKPPPPESAPEPPVPAPSSESPGIAGDGIAGPAGEVTNGIAAQPADCGDKAPGGGGGGEPTAPPTQSPFTSNLSITSGEENSEEGKREAFVSSPPGSPVDGAMAEQIVTATDAPGAEAISNQGRLGVPEMVEMVGGQARASSGVIEGTARQSTGVVTMGQLSLLGGMVVLEDLRWEATHRTGEGA